VSREEIENMTAGKTHGGIAAEAESRVYQDIGDCFTEDNVFLALTEGIEDPFNFGYILRTLYSGGCSGIITRRRNWENAESTILKSSAGASEYMNIVMTEGGQYVEVQGSGEEAVFTAEEMGQMLALASEGIAAITKAKSMPDAKNTGSWDQILAASYAETGQGDKAAHQHQQVQASHGSLGSLG
jgi:tRNA G18 (ribose-2'-O)-methylase SpoU